MSSLASAPGVSEHVYEQPGTVRSKVPEHFATEKQGHARPSQQNIFLGSDSVDESRRTT